jgi:hypothetical protein
VLVALSAGLSIHAQQLVVTTLADSGPGSLRAQVAAHHGTIVFSVSGTITLKSPLVLQVQDSLIIDGGGKIVLSGGGRTQIATIPEFTYLTLRNLTLTEGRATATGTLYPGLGGAIRNGGNLTLDRVTAIRNSGANGAGAIAHYTNDGWLTVTNSLFEFNTVDSATGSGGAITVGSISYATITNNTFIGNYAATGGAIANVNAIQPDIVNNTFVGNFANTGGALSVFGTWKDVVKNNIFAYNVSRTNCALIPIQGSSLPPTYDNRGGNFSFPDNTCPGTVANPRLGVLSDNGGPTQTIPLLPGSPAIDAAVDCIDINAQTIKTDQRGVLRPQGQRCDSGAFERAAMSFDEYLSPISDPPRVNTERAGQSVTVKFGVNEGFVGMDLFRSGYPVSQQISCSTGAPIGAATPINQVGGLAFEYFPRGYSFVWKTDPAWANTCRQLIIQLKDGLDHPSLFSFR